MPVWLKVAGVQPVVLWHVSQLLLLAIWVAFLPGAVVPLWQVEQAAVIPV
jgi:hypothetical protein